MERLFFPVLSLALQRFRPRYNARLQLMAEQIRILRSRIDSDRIVPNPAEKTELLRLGASFDHDVSGPMHVSESTPGRYLTLESPSSILRRNRRGYASAPLNGGFTHNCERDAGKSRRNPDACARSNE